MSAVRYNGKNIKTPTTCLFTSQSLPNPSLPSPDPLLDLAAPSKASAVAMPAAAVQGVGGAADAEELFRTKRIPEIRAAEGATRREISAKEEELRQLVGRSYRDLLDSADSILLIKQSSDSISDNLSHISSIGNLQINSSKPNV